MKVSVITSVFNCRDTIDESIQSVLSQTYENIEYIIIDGASSDGTLDIIKNYEDKVTTIVSEPDKGIYDGLNKGISLATGNIICFLHADDLYANEHVIKKIVTIFETVQTDAVYGDLVYVRKENINKIVRYWQGGKFSLSKLKLGWMPPHPTFFVKKEIYEKLGAFDSSMNISADYDFMLRVLTKTEYTITYLPEVLYCMRIGGESNRSLKNIFWKSLEDFKAIRRNKVGGIGTLLIKNISKIPQFFRKNK